MTKKLKECYKDGLLKRYKLHIQDHREIDLNILYKNHHSHHKIFNNNLLSKLKKYLYILNVKY